MKKKSARVNPSIPSQRWSAFSKAFHFSVGKKDEKERFCFKPLHSNQIKEAIAFLKKNFPGLENSYYRDYLSERFYRQEVALLDHWARHRSKREFYVAVLEHVESGRLCGLGTGGREAGLPMVTTHVGALEPRYRETGLFEYFLKLCEEAVRRSGFEQILCVASGCTPAAQRAYLKIGFKACGIVPGGDIIKVQTRKGQGKLYYVPDIYFFKLINDGPKKQLPVSHWQLVPEVRAVWRAIEKSGQKHR